MKNVSINNHESVKLESEKLQVILRATHIF